MTDNPGVRTPFPAYVRVLAVLATLVVSGLGLLALATSHVPERSTRYGIVGPLDGPLADGFGLSMLFFGLLPLMLVMRTPKGAALLGGFAAIFGVVSLFIGPWLLG